MKHFQTITLFLFISMAVNAQIPSFKAEYVANYAEKSHNNSGARIMGEESYNALSKQFNNYDVFSLDTKGLSSFVKGSGQNAVFSLEFGNKYSWDVELTQSNLLSNKYKSYTLSDAGKQVGNAPDNILYKGTLLNQQGKIRMTIDGKRISGFITTNGKKIYFEQLKGLTKSGDESNYVIYQAQDVKEDPSLTCQALKDDHAKESINQRMEAEAATCNGLWQNEIATYATYSRFNSAGGTTQVNNEILTILNNVQGNYDEYKVKLVVVEQVVATCASCEPWSAQTSPSDLLTKFTAWGPTGFTQRHDEGVCFFDGTGSGTVGVAWIAAICTKNRYAVADKMSTAQTNRELVAHEMGHNFGANHDGSGTPYIMAPSVNTATQWSSASNTAITNLLAKQTCFACIADNTPPAICNAPTALTVIGVAGNNATLSWSNVIGSTAYKVLYHSTESTTWTELNPAGNTLNITGLQTLTGYVWQVSTTCLSTSSGLAMGPNFTTTSDISIPICSTTTGLSYLNLKSTSVSLDWNDASGIVDYTAQIRQNGGAWQSFTIATSGLNVSSLQSNTAYQWQVRANCATGSSDYSSGPGFTTTAPTTVAGSKLPWVEDFTLADQTIIDNGATAWSSTLLLSNSGYGEVRNALFKASAATSEWISEKIFFGSANGVTFSTDLKASSSNENEDKLKIDYRFNDNAWTSIASYGGNQNRTISFRFSGTVQSLQIRMTLIADQADDYIAIDNVKFVCSSNCPGSSLNSANESTYFESTAEIIVNSEPEIQFSPNPFPQNVSFNISNVTVNEVDVIVYSISGNVVQHTKGHPVSQNIVIGDNLPEGPYFVRIVSTDFNKVIKVIKAK